MGKYETLKRKLEAREKILGTAASFFTEPQLIGQMRRDDLDFIIFDMEHGFYNAEKLAPSLFVCRALGVPSLVRVQDSAYHLIAKAIDMGADGIILPRVESAGQIRTAVNATRFYPTGIKGCGGAGQFREGESFDEFQKGRFLIPQIESPEGINILPALLAEFGEYISAIIIGPYDMSMMVGTPLDIGSGAMRSAIGQAVKICNDYKKSVGIFCNSVEEAAAYKEMGMNLFWYCLDIMIFMQGFNSAFDALAKI